MINISYQVVLFGNHEDISPKPKTLAFFIEKFEDKELIPSSFQELGSKGLIDRFRLSNSEGVWEIEFHSNRIDIKHVNQDVNVSKFYPLNEFIAEAKQIVEIIDDKFQKKYHRLSLITRTFVDGFTPEQIKKIYYKLNNTIPFYHEIPITDWNTRTSSKASINVNDSSELVNVISTIKQVKGNLKIDSEETEVEGIELLFDLNTNQNNTDYRFRQEEFNSFIDEIYKVENDLKDQYLKLLSE